MPEKRTIERARKDKRQGKSPSTQAGEFVREEIEHIREGKHGARSAKQAIAIGLSKARRAGVDLDAPKKGKASDETREQAQRDLKKGKSNGARKVSAKRSRATTNALKKEGTSAASHLALSRHAKAVASKRTAAERSASAKEAASTRARTSDGAKKPTAAKKSTTKKPTGAKKSTKKAGRASKKTSK